MAKKDINTNIDNLFVDDKSSKEVEVDKANEIISDAIDDTSTIQEVEYDAVKKKKPQTISWSQKPRGLVAGSREELKATASSGLPISYQVIDGAAHLQDDVLIVDGSGKITVRAEQGGNEEYESAFLDKVINVKQTVKPATKAKFDKDDDRVQVSFYVPKSVHQKYRVVAPRYRKTMRELLEAIVINWIDEFEFKHGKIELLEID